MFNTILHMHLKPLVKSEVILIVNVIVDYQLVSKTTHRGILKGRPAKQNYNDYDMFAVVTPHSVNYIELNKVEGKQISVYVETKTNREEKPIIHLTITHNNN